MRRRYLCGALVGVLATAGALTTAAASAPPASSHAQAKPSMMRTRFSRQARTSRRGRGVRTTSLPRRRGRDRRGDRAEGLPRALGFAVEQQRPVRRGAAPASFFSDVGGSSWLNSVTQYCQGVASGTVFCNGSTGTAAGNAAGMLQRVSGTTTPRRHRPRRASRSSPREAVRAAQHFGNTAFDRRTARAVRDRDRARQQRVGLRYAVLRVAQLHRRPLTATSPTRTCRTSRTRAPRAGRTSTASGANAGITIVEGHELAETITDQFPNGGWLDRQAARRTATSAPGSSPARALRRASA